MCPVAAHIGNQLARKESIETKRLVPLRWGSPTVRLPETLPFQRRTLKYSFEIHLLERKSYSFRIIFKGTQMSIRFLFLKYIYTCEINLERRAWGSDLPI